jgi:GNAT superfamily N-acetyltransferase
LAAAAAGRFPDPDGTLAVVPAPRPYRAAVVAFTAHSLVATDLPAAEVHAHLAPDDLGAPVAAPFLAWLGQRLGATPGMLDAVLVHHGAPPPAAAAGQTPPPAPPGLRLVPAPPGHDHPRVARARRLRQDLQVLTTPDDQGLVTLGRGLVGRWEISLELEPTARGHGLGRAMLAAARALLPPDEPLFAQVSPGNAQSLRAFLAAGYHPIGAEVLFP